MSFPLDLYNHYNNVKKFNLNNSNNTEEEDKSTYTFTTKLVIYFTIGVFIYTIYLVFYCSTCESITVSHFCLTFLKAIIFVIMLMIYWIFYLLQYFNLNLLGLFAGPPIFVNLFSI